MTKKTKTIVGLSTRWGTRFGGVNSFNKDLLSAFAGVAYSEAETVCVVLHATQDEIDDARSNQVRLISLDCPNASVFSNGHEAAVWAAIENSGVELVPSELVWLGHDRLTGGIALALAKMQGGRAAVIHHMSYGSYESFAENSGLAKQKEDEQRSIFLRADIALAIGPLLRDELVDMLDTSNVAMLIPGLPDITARKNPRRLKAFLSGRLSDDAKKIKQAHLGVAAFAHAISRADANSALPDSWRGESDPKLILRGVDFEGVKSAENLDAELELKRFAEKFAGRAFTLHALPFTTIRDELFADLASASVALMPSWHEGFGLVAWEAIAAGVPLILTKKSGVYRFLKELDDGMYASMVTAIDVAGTNDEPYFQQRDVETLADALILFAKEPEAYRQRAARLREELAKRYSWAECARQLARFCGWDFTDSPFNSGVAVNALPAEPPALGSPTQLEIPTSCWRIEDGRSDSQLLRAEEAAIPFDPKREPFLAEQLSWAVEQSYSVTVRLLTGAGGTGKTRLALELCERLRKLGWLVGFVPGSFDIRSAIELGQKLKAGSVNCCVVIDYAETRQEIILALLKTILTRPSGVVVRLLLLARNGGDWWKLLPSKDTTCESLLEGMATTGPFQLPDLHDSETARNEAYKVALDAFAQRLRLPTPEHSPSLAAGHFAHPLYLQMAALMALHGERPRTAEGLTRTLVGHERRYWRNSLPGLAVDPGTTETQAALLMALATLSGGIDTYRQIEKVWQQAGGQPLLLKPLFNALIQLYPARKGLEGWRPDLLGEALIAQVLLSLDGAHILDAVIREGGQRVRKSCFTVLARMLRNRADIAQLLEDVVVEHFVPSIHDLITVCIETPSPLPSIVQSAFDRLKYQKKIQAAGLIQPYFRFELLPLSGLNLAVERFMVEHARINLSKKQNLDAKSDYGEALANLAVALLREGQGGQAVMAAKEALEVHRILAKSKPERFERSVGTSLDLYATALSNQGLQEEALIAGEQALAIHRKLAKSPVRSESDFAKSLDNYSTFLAEVGRDEDAIPFSQQALEIREKLAERSPAAWEPELAITLANYALRLSRLGHTEDAMAAIQKSLSIMRRVAEKKPERFEDSYADTLINFSAILTDQGKTEEALTWTRQALGVYRRLATAKPERFENGLGMALNNYAADLDDNGELSEAIEVARESLQIRRKLAAADPKRFEFRVAITLANYANYLTRRGEVEEALAADDEAIGIRRRLAETSPDRFGPDLAVSLTNWANHLSHIGRWAEAYVAEIEAAELFQLGAQRAPRKYAYRAQRSRLKALLWRWLARGDEMSGADYETTPTVIRPRDKAVLLFQQDAQLAFQEPAHAVILSALEKWRLLDSDQRNDWDEHYLLLAAMAEKLVVNTDMVANWREEFHRLHARTQGRIPSWMLEVARRAEVVFC